MTEKGEAPRWSVDACIVEEVSVVDVLAIDMALRSGEKHPGTALLMTDHPACPDEARTRKDPTEMPTSTQDRDQISAVIDQYRRGFATMNIDDLLAIWDQDYEKLVYVALEETAPRRTWTDIEAYYRGVVSTDPAFRVVAMQVDTLSIGALDDVAHVFCRFRFEGEHDDHEDSVIAEGRATFLLHRHSTAWKVIHYHESAPPDAIPERPADPSLPTHR